MNQIIRKQTIILGDQYDLIKTTVNQKSCFRYLSEICLFDDKKRTLTFKTEKIHPDGTGIKRNAVMLLFSNPHPLSVKTGNYFSEPQSRSFWQRLFDCKCLAVPDSIKYSVANWDSRTPDLLSECLLNCNYSGKLKIFFDCLEALPTNQYRDLNKLFPGKSGQALRKQVLQYPGFHSLLAVSRENSIQSWVVFSAEAYRCLVGEIDTAKNAPKRICAAIDDYYDSKDTAKLWDSLKDLKRTIEYEAYSVTVYLALIARCKNWRTNSGERYFTLMLDHILDDILAAAH